METKGDTHKAIEYYKRANDSLSLVRIFCKQEMLEVANTFALEAAPESSSSCFFHIAQHCEMTNKVNSTTTVIDNNLC